MPKKKKSYKQRIFYDWCKSCGLCVEFCPKDVFERNELGQPVVKDPEKCIGCRFCELHCPDFAITISEGDNDQDKDSETGKNKKKKGGGS